jgi:UDP-N-acetylmuramate dehydrogenase
LCAGGSNVVLTGDVRRGAQGGNPGHAPAARDRAHWIVEAGAGERWHDVVAWTLAQGYPGLENMALIPGTVGAAPVQNIGAYGWSCRTASIRWTPWTCAPAPVLAECRAVRLRLPRLGLQACAQQRPGHGAGGCAVITTVRLALPKPWKPELGYLDLQRRQQEEGVEQPTAQQIFDWVCAIRRAKLPDPAVIGNAGSFFKNPTVSEEQCATSWRASPRSCTTPWTTAASSWRPAG